MTIAQIRYFLVAAEHLNFTAAAELLYITQPSLSRQISSMEGEIGAKLFSRINNVVSLTKAGQLLYEKLTRLYDDYQDIIKEVRDVSSGNRGHLTIGILEDQILGDTLIKAINDIIGNHPNAVIDIVRRDSYSLFSGLQDGTIDAGLMLVYDELIGYGFRCIPLSIDKVCLAIAKSQQGANYSTITMEELTTVINPSLPLVMASLETFPPPLRESLCHFPPFQEGMEDTWEVSFSSVKFVTSFSAIPLYVTAGIGVTLANRGNLLRNDPNVKMIPVADGPTMTQGIVWYKNNDNPLINELCTNLYIQAD